MKYRKKPVEIEAVAIAEILHNVVHSWKDLPEWVKESYEKGDILFTDTGLHIRTLEGQLIGPKVDMLIRGIKGELYPCRMDIFLATYDKVSE